MSHRNNFDDKFDRKAKAQERRAFHQKRDSESYKYNDGFDDDEFEDEVLASKGRSANFSNFKQRK